MAANDIDRVRKLCRRLHELERQAQAGGTGKSLLALSLALRIVLGRA